MTNPKLNSATSAQCGVSRRAFLGASTLGGTALLATGWSALLQTNSSRAATADENAPWFEATIPQLQALMASGALTSRALTLAYLQRIDRLNPLLNAVIETNPNAVAIATQLDNKRRSGQLLGPLHGIPLLLKDNIATDDHLQTTAGSLALLHSRVPADAPLTNRLRAAGAVILGKANLSEWANFRGFAPCPSSWTCLNGWSGRGGFTQNPYILAHSQDTAGPMGRTVTDVAILLGALQTPFGSVAGASLPPEYTQFLRRGALRGARIGVDRKFFTLDFGGEAPFDAVAEHAIAVMRSLGATIVDPVDSGNPNLFGQAEFTVLLSEFKTQVAGYLANLNHTSMRTLADLIAFNEAHCPQEMKFYGQEIFELAQETSGDLTDPDYVAARTLCVQLSRAQGIDAAIQAQQLAAIVTPTWSFGTSLPAVAGYPNISVPVAIADDGRPAGIWMYSGFLQEPRLLALAYDLEQEIQPRVQPRFAGTPPDWTDAGVCASLPKPHDRGHIWKNKPLRPHW